MFRDAGAVLVFAESRRNHRSGCADDQHLLPRHINRHSIGKTYAKRLEWLAVKTIKQFFGSHSPRIVSQSDCALARPSSGGYRQAMTSDSGRTVSVWMATAETPQQEALGQDTTADVCVVGAGMAGMSTAYLLAREGKSVVVLDDGPVAGGETCRTSAHLVFYNDDGLSKVESLHGTEGLRLASESHSAAVDRIETNVRDENIDCDFQRLNGYLFVSPDGQGMDFLKQELDAAHRVGLTDAHWVDRAPLPSFDTGRCLCYPRQAQFHPLKYLRGLTDAFLRRGGRLFNHTHAAKIQGGAQARVETSEGKTVTAGLVVVATNSPVVDRFAIHTKQVPWRTYVIGLRVPKDSINRGLYWDTEEVYHYVRLQPMPGSGSDEYEVLLVGGEDHKTAHANDPDQRYARLEAWTRARFPMAQKMIFHWSGQVMETIDYLAFIGRDPLNEPNVYIATGDSGMGMTHGHIASILLTDLILGRPNPWEKLYDPTRKTLKAAPQYATENLSIAAQYRDLLTAGEVRDAREIPPRQGAIMRRGMGKVTVYRDEKDELFVCSAVCPHLGCVVRWNYAEGTWDCPCHGSRFDPYGRVINGPANSNLRPL